MEFVPAPSIQSLQEVLTIMLTVGHYVALEESDSTLWQFCLFLVMEDKLLLII